MGGSPGWYTWTYPQQRVSDMSDHIVDLLGGLQPQREGAPLILYQQLEEQIIYFTRALLPIYPMNLFNNNVTETSRSPFWHLVKLCKS